MISSRSPKRRRTRASRCSSQSWAIRSSSSLSSAARTASRPAERRWSRPARSSLARSISSRISFRGLTPGKTNPPFASFPLPVAELANPVLGQSEEVPDLVEDGDANLAAQLLRFGEPLDEREPVDHDLVGERTGALAGRAEPAVEAEEAGLIRVLVLDHDRDVVERLRQLGRNVVQRRADVLLELLWRHQYAGCRGRRLRKRKTVAIPKRKPPMWAKNATPPPASGCRIEKPPSQSWNRNQSPRNRTAGISWKKIRMKKNAVSTRAFGSSSK